MTKKILLGLIIVSLVLFIVKPAFAVEEAIVLFTEGDVRVKNIEADTWQSASAEMVLSNGDSLKTGDDSWAEIGFGDELENVVKVKENTVIEITDLGSVKIDLLKGELRSLIENLDEDSTFEIKTPQAICGARGTGWDTSTDREKLTVDTFESEVYLHRLSQKGAVVERSIIAAGKSGMIKNLTTPIKIENLPSEKIKDWKKWKKNLSKKKSVIKQIIKRRKGKLSKRSLIERKKIERIDRIHRFRRLRRRIALIERDQLIKQRLITTRINSGSTRKEGSDLIKRIRRRRRRRPPPN